MCPLDQTSSVSEIDYCYSSDEEIVSFLGKLTTESDLPYNVVADSTPYQRPPSDLPEGTWYLVHPNEKKESVYGFWKAKEETREIYSNSVFIGWKTTLEYFEGQIPHGKRTDWLMQEYAITQNKTCDKDEQKESKLLCRVFFCGGPSSEIESTEMNNFEVGEFSEVAVDEESNLLECLFTGDFLELNDLIDPQLHYSSSWNSTCSKWSDEYFDSSAFLRAFEEEESNYMRGLQLSPSYRFTNPNDTVLHHVVSRSRSSGSMKSEVDELSKDEKGHDNTSTKRHNSKGKETTGEPSEETKAGSSRMKKLKTYFCFASF
ncbi:hypothetical protein ACP275_14G048900 [Erythranthe tilingii]